MLGNPRKYLSENLVDLFDSFRFEARTALGRLFARRLHSTPLTYLHLGCGSNHFDQFLNTDCFLNPKVDLHIDMRFPLPLQSDHWTGIYTHHVVEHIAYHHADQLFRESHRILKPGGILRIIVPDAELFTHLYSEGDPARRDDIFKLYPSWAMKDLSIQTPMEMLDHVFRDTKWNRHCSAWDFQTMTQHLTRAGFTQIDRKTINESADPMLANRDNPNWAKFSLYVEARKS